MMQTLNGIELQLLLDLVRDELEVAESNGRMLRISLCKQLEKKLVKALEEIS